MGPYRGNLQQNLYLLRQIRNNNYFKGGLPGAKKTSTPKETKKSTRTTATTMAKQAARDVAVTPFSDIMTFEEYFPSELAKSSAAQRSARYYNPILQEQQSSVVSDYANRGLSRSGKRASDVMRTYRDIADQETQMREKLYGQAESEAREGYQYQRGLYEESPKSYKPATVDRTDYEYEFPEESPQRYAKTYRDWLRKSYNI